MLFSTSKDGTFVKVQYVACSSKGVEMYCLLCVYVSYSYAPVMDNSDSPSIVEQLSQGPSLVTIPLLMIVF